MVLKGRRELIEIERSPNGGQICAMTHSTHSVPSRGRERVNGRDCGGCSNIICSLVSLFLSGRRVGGIKEELNAAHHMRSIGSKICDEDVSRDDPKQTIDSRSFRIRFTSR
jgi:hypothetical protein